MDISNSMYLIAKRCFPNAIRTTDRFHIQKLTNDTLQEMRIAHRWDAIQEDSDAREEAKCLGESYPHTTCQWRHQKTTAGMQQIPSSNRQTSGLKIRNKKLRFSSSNTLTSKKPIH